MSLLYALQATGNVQLKKIDEPNGNFYLLTMKGVSDQVTWFKDRPERGAGRETVTDLVTGWDEGFFDSNPNSALTYTDKDGNPDTIIFEQFSPRYNEKRDTLKSRIRIHDDQVLSDMSKTNTNNLSDLSVEAQSSNNSLFEKKFTGASLFIDGAFAKWTRVSFINNTNTDMRFIRADSETNNPNWWNLVGGAFSAGFAALAFTGVPIPLVGGVIALPAGYALGASAIVQLGAFFSSVGSKGVTPKNQDSVYTLKPGERATFVDTDTRFGIKNGVKDINQYAMIQSPDGNKAINVGLAGFDNPILGTPKAYYATNSEGSAYNVVYDSGDPGKTTVTNPFFPAISANIEYFGSQYDPGTNMYTKTWDIQYTGNVNW